MRCEDAACRRLTQKREKHKEPGTTKVPGSSYRERKETGIPREDGGESRQDTKKPAASGGLVRLRGIEPPHPAPEAGALSTELQAYTIWLSFRTTIIL